MTEGCQKCHMHDMSFTAPKQVRAVFPLYGLHLLTPRVLLSHAGRVFRTTDCVCVCSASQSIHSSRKRESKREITSKAYIRPNPTKRTHEDLSLPDLCWFHVTLQGKPDMNCCDGDQPQGGGRQPQQTSQEAVWTSSATRTKMNLLTIILFCFLTMRRTIISQKHIQ